MLNKRYGLISVTPDLFTKINKRYAMRVFLIRVTLNIFDVPLDTNLKKKKYSTDVTEL